MHISFVDPKQQYQEIKGEVLAEIAQALDSMQLFLGPNVQEFEAAFARYCDTEFAVGVGSGTEALHLASRACGVGQGHEVITVSHTYFATVEALSLLGARPSFVDIDPRTYTMDTSQIESRITGDTRAILPVHLYGHPADMGPILDLARAYGLKVIEDACQAHGAEYLGRRAGSLGDVGCFSFYLTKNLGAYGEAGMIVTSDPEIARTCRMLRDHGQDRKYYHSVVGVNGRLDEIQAAVLKVKLPHLDDWNRKRRDLAEAYNANLPESIVKPIELPWAKHVYHLFAVRTPDRDQLKAHLESRGVATGMHYPVPIHLQEACRGLPWSNGSLSVTEKTAREILSLPMYPELTMEEVDYVCGCVRDFVDSQLETSSP